MEHTQNTTCRNCQHPLPEGASFCPACGQKNTDGRITVKELVGRFFSDLLNLDGRIFQTTAALVVPGKLTKNFFEGKHIRYYHPVRLFILAGALFIALLSYTVSKTDINDVDRLWEQREKAYELKYLKNQLDSLSEGITQEYGHVDEALDSLNARFLQNNPLIEFDSVEITDIIDVSLDDNNMRSSGIKVAVEDLINVSEDSIAVKYGVNGFWERYIFVQNIRILKSLKGFLFYAIGNILWMTLIMMPMLALVLKLLYLKKPFLYIEHLIFSFHTHTFGFLLYSVLFLIGSYKNFEILNWAFIVIIIYFLFALKRFYEQSWGMTFFKFILINVLYIIVFICAALLTMMASAFLF
ncbi:MAG: DUF3667 domain-containing protein [Bacteroidota bacterium]